MQAAPSYRPTYLLIHHKHNHTVHYSLALWKLVGVGTNWVFDMFLESYLHIIPLPVHLQQTQPSLSTVKVTNSTKTQSTAYFVDGRLTAEQF